MVDVCVYARMLHPLSRVSTHEWNEKDAIRLSPTEPDGIETKRRYALTASDFVLVALVAYTLLWILPRRLYRLTVRLRQQAASREQGKKAE